MSCSVSGDVGCGKVGSVATVKAKREVFSLKKNENHIIIMKKKDIVGYCIKSKE